MLSTNTRTFGLHTLLEEKGLTADQRRRIIAASAALELVVIAVTRDGTTTTLAEEMQRLGQYTDMIDNALRKA